MSISLLSVLSAAKAHLAPLAGESAGYLVLAVADQVAAAPRSVDAESVDLMADGTLRLRAGAATSPQAAEHALRTLLDQLLLTASTVTPALMRAGRRHSTAGVESLIREVEAALIPVNRAAAKRTLSRLYRETARALEAGRLNLVVPEPKASEAVTVIVPEPRPPMMNIAVREGASRSSESVEEVVAVPEAVASATASELLPSMGSSDAYVLAALQQSLPTSFSQASAALPIASQMGETSETSKTPKFGTLPSSSALSESAPVSFAASAASVPFVSGVSLCPPLYESPLPLPVTASTFEHAPVPDANIAWDAAGVAEIDDSDVYEVDVEIESELEQGESVAAYVAQVAEVQALPCASYFDDDDDNAYTIPLPTFELTPCREPVEEVGAAEAIPALAAELRQAVSETPPPVTLVDVRSDVSELADTFSVQEASLEPDLCRALRELAGLELTPGVSAVRASPSVVTKAR